MPTRGNAFSRGLGKAFLKITGWRLQGALPDLPKFMIIAAPHTSNWDFVIGMAGVFAIGLNVHWMGKHTLFKRPFGCIMRGLGGVPIERAARHGVVDLIVEEFRRREQFLLAITPEGTRGRVDKWKTGFYYIALQSKLPVVPGFLDFGRKHLGFGPMIHPSGDADADLRLIRDFYANIQGKRPELFSPDAIRS